MKSNIFIRLIANKASTTRSVIRSEDFTDHLSYFVHCAATENLRYVAICISVERKKFVPCTAANDGQAAVSGLLCGIGILSYRSILTTLKELDVNGLSFNTNAITSPREGMTSVLACAKTVKCIALTVSMEVVLHAAQRLEKARHVARFERSRCAAHENDLDTNCVDG